MKKGLEKRLGPGHGDYLDSIVDATDGFAAGLKVPDDHAKEHFVAGGLQ